MFRARPRLETWTKACASRAGLTRDLDRALRVAGGTYVRPRVRVALHAPARLEVVSSPDA